LDIPLPHSTVDPDSDDGAHQSSASNENLGIGIR
jgi:hypothetical protein